jgi:hypothetical protein
MTQNFWAPYIPNAKYQQERVTQNKFKKISEPNIITLQDTKRKVNNDHEPLAIPPY